MNYLFFLLIFLIPVGIASAETGKNFDTVENQDGSITWTSHTERILNGNSWVDYITTNNANYISIETAYGSVKLDKTTCEFSFYTSGIIGGKQPILVDSIKAQRATFGTESWIDISQINTAACLASVSGNTLTATKSHTVGLMEYKYIFTGSSWKTQLEATNLSALIDQKFGFNQTFNLNRDTINYGGSQKNLDNFDGQSFGRTFLENNQAKVIDLLNGHKFDFDLGFANLESVSIMNTGLDKSRLIFTYTHNANILLPNQKKIIDPTFTSSEAQKQDGILRDTDNDNTCETTPGSVDRVLTATTLQVGLYNSAGTEDCARIILEFDIATIPDTSTINDVDITSEWSSTNAGSQNCDWVEMTTRPSTGTPSTIWANTNSGVNTEYVSGDASCRTANSNLDLGASADTRLQSQLVGGDWFGVAVREFNDEGRALVAANQFSEWWSEEGSTGSVLTVVYTFTPPNRVNDLVALDVRPTSVDIDWTAPNLNGLILSGYQINRTTPWNSNVATVVVNNTASSNTAYTLLGLTGSTQYSIRVGVWTTTQSVSNMTGNVLNVTTDVDPTAAFSTGTFSTLFNGTDIRQIFYSRTDINSTSLLLNVTATNTIQLNCNFYYKYSMVNRTYTNIANTSISATRDMATFRFLNVDNEVIDVLCWNQYNNSTNARYVITQTNFPFLEQIANFRNGTFGTMGMFGALDFISMIAVIASMVGFNRVNESVGIIFGLFMIGALAVLSNGEIISWASTFTVGFAVLIMWAIGTTRKD